MYSFKMSLSQSPVIVWPSGSGQVDKHVEHESNKSQVFVSSTTIENGLFDFSLTIHGNTIHGTFTGFCST
jgi:hypothetical protein